MTAPSNCEPCSFGDHDGCWSVLSDAEVDACVCYDADPARHETDLARYRAMGFDHGPPE